MVTEFDTDTELRPGEDGAWHGTVTDRWSIREGHPNGGYIAALLMQALAGEAPQPDPLTMTVHYLERPAVRAPCRVTVEHLRHGRSHATMLARLQQHDTTAAIALATFGRWRDDAPTSVQAEAPEVPGPDGSRPPQRPPFPDMTFRDRFEERVPPVWDPSQWRLGGKAEYGSWIRLVDRPLDARAVPLFMDAFIPAVFATYGFGFAPTIELTVHWRGRPHTAWHLGRFRTRFYVGGYVEEDGELWGEDGVLVAQSRQLARFIPPT